MKTKLGDPFPIFVKYHRPRFQEAVGAVHTPFQNGSFGQRPRLLGPRHERSRGSCALLRVEEVFLRGLPPSVTQLADFRGPLELRGASHSYLTVEAHIPGRTARSPPSHSASRSPGRYPPKTCRSRLARFPDHVRAHGGS